MNTRELIGTTLATSWVTLFLCWSLFQVAPLEWTVPAKRLGRTVPDDKLAADPVPKSIASKVSDSARGDSSLDTVLSLAGLGVLIASLLIMRTQAQHTKLQVDEARATVRSMRSNERPWLLWGAVKMHYPAGIPFMATKLPVPAVDFTWQNRGSGLAFITEHGAWLFAMDASDELFAQRDIAGIPLGFDLPLLTGEFRKFECRYRNGETLESVDRAALDEGSKRFVLMAYVKYRDQFGENHESRFAYSIDHRHGDYDSKVIGGDAYNRYT